MEPGKERLEKLLKLEREINHLHASYSKAEFNLNAINPANGNGILLAACQQADVLSLVLGKGVNPLARDEILNTALHHSTDPQAVPILVRAGLSVNAVNSSGNTPLHQHAEGGNADVVKALIRAGADVNARNTLGKTPLHLIHRSFADESSSLKIADLLLDAGADPNAADDNGKTPLHDAVGVNANFDVPIALRLIDRGASIDAEDECGLRPLHFAVVRESNLIKHLLALGASSHGVIGHKHWIESDLREKSRFRTALRIEYDQSLRIFAECLRKNPDVREEDLQFASELFKRKKTFFKQHSAMLASHMAKKAVDACLSSNERALHTSPSP
jgi:ankyrin repeat protein